MRMLTGTAHRRLKRWKHNGAKSGWAYPRKASWSYSRPDVGTVGRGRRVIPRPLKAGTLGGKGFFDFSAKTRRAFYAKLAKKIGEKKVMGKLSAIMVFNKRTNPALSERARTDRKWVAGTFKGKKRVGYPKGLREAYA